MTNLEKYHKILKENLSLKKDENYDDGNLVYNKHPRWTSIVHMDMVADLEAAFHVNFNTLDIMKFSTYSNGLEVLRQLGVDV